MELRNVFYFVIHTTLKIYEDSRTQTKPKDFFLRQFGPVFMGNLISILTRLRKPLGENSFN